MAAKRVVKKTTVKKSASKKPARPTPSVNAKRRVPDALENPEANDEVLSAGKDESKGPAKRIAKVVNLVISVGDDDRGRSFEKFIADIEKQLGARKPPFVDKNGKRLPGPHVAVTGGHYILDGKVCLPQDYDPKKKGFKPGATPPEWAGGPKHSRVPQTAIQRQMDYDLANLSSDEYDKKYRLGKYAPKIVTKTPEQIREEQRIRMEQYRAEKAAKEDAELEEFEWDEDDVLDDDKMGAVADKSAKAAAARMKKGKPKRVVKKSATKKKTVRRVKK